MGFGEDECPFVDAGTLAAADPTGNFSEPEVKYVSFSATCSFVFPVSSDVPARNGVLTLQLSDGLPADIAVQQSEVYATTPAPVLGADTFRLTGLPENLAIGNIQLGVLEPVDGAQSLLITFLIDPEGSSYTAANVRTFADAVATAVTLG
ncbi:hypothetical protein ACFWHR_12280 [Leucobacter sp. NPDC058333]|uniref:hypothetical protein n=1 Tax=Leucobacter sp. NPDC058333 TaxID=3346450 RepID=UPI00364B1BBE